RRWKSAPVSGKMGGRVGPSPVKSPGGQDNVELPMRTRIGTIAGILGLTALLFFLGGDHAPLPAQLGERPGHSLDNPIDTPRDLSGLSIKIPRIRIAPTTDPSKRGGSMYLQQVDPWLGYKWGWSLTQREFRERDGVYGDAGKLDGLLLPDGATKMM